LLAQNPLKIDVASPGLLGDLCWLTPEFLKSKAVSPGLLGNFP